MSIDASAEDDGAMQLRLPSGGLIARVRRHLVAATRRGWRAREAALKETRCSNRELLSANETLESLKDELKSVNKELQTVTARLSEKVDALDQANSDLRNLFASTQIAAIFLDREMIIRGFTAATATIYDLLPTDQGRPLTDIVAHLCYSSLRDDVQQVLQTLQPLERRVRHSENKAQYILRILPYRSTGETISGTVVTFIDVTSMVQAEEHQRFLVDELNHRVKNMLTVLVSLLSQTLRQSATLEEFAEAFLGRVRALTASYTLLSSQNWMNVPLHDLLMAEIRPYAARDLRNVVMRGPKLLLGSGGALAIGMALHELATNAVKYGALSTQEGRVTITWHISTGASSAASPNSQRFVVDWVETNGPPVMPPTRRGFGTKLIERGFVYDLSGEALLRFDVTGVHATLSAPMREILAPQAERHLVS